MLVRTIKLLFWSAGGLLFLFGLPFLSLFSIGFFLNDMSLVRCTDKPPCPMVSMEPPPKPAVAPPSPMIADLPAPPRPAVSPPSPKAVVQPLSPPPSPKTMSEDK